MFRSITSWLLEGDGLPLERRGEPNRVPAVCLRQRLTQRTRSTISRIRDGQRGNLKTGIYFHQSEADTAVLTRQNRSEQPGRQGGKNPGLERIFRRKAVRGELRGRDRIVLPVVVCDQERAIAVAQFQGRIGQNVTQTRLGERRSDAAHGHRGAAIAVPKNEASDHHIVTRSDKAARADVGQLRRRGCDRRHRFPPVRYRWSDCSPPGSPCMPRAEASRRCRIR